MSGNFPDFRLEINQNLFREKLTLCNPAITKVEFSYKRNTGISPKLQVPYKNCYLKTNVENP